MQPAARTPRLGLHAALALLAGMLACLYAPAMLPRAVSWALALSGAAWWASGRPGWKAGVLACGIGWAGVQAGWVVDAWLPASLEQKDIPVEGRVLGLPESDGHSTRYRFRVDAAREPALRGKIIQLGWYAPKHGSAPAVEAGSRWRLVVKLKRPHGLRNPGPQDSERTLLANRVIAQGSVRAPGTAARLESGTGIDAVRDRIGQRVGAVPSDAARFIRALSVGDTRGISDDDWDVLRAAGLTHLIAISGSHVAMAAMVGVALAWLLWALAPALGHHVPRRAGMAVAGAIVATLYAALAGSEVPTLRTLLMMISAAGAIGLRRRLGVAHALSLAAILLALLDPLNLLRPGFWLSFGGVAWLAWCLQGGRRGVLREFLSAQGVATVGLLPLCVLFFAQASWVSILANLIAVPWWGLVVVPMSLLGVLLDALHAGWGAWPWQAAAWLFDLSWPVFQHMATWPGAQLRLPEPSLLALPLALIGAFWLLLPRGIPGKPLALLLWLPLLAPARPAIGPGEARVSIIDVGQGLSVIVRTQGHVLVYDTGPAMPGGFDAGKQAVLPTLGALGIHHVDRIVLSHADNDHAGGARSVREGIAVDGTEAPPHAPTPHEHDCSAGEHWAWDGVAFDVLSPAPGSGYVGNASSCVVRMATRAGTMLFTGDIDKATESTLVAHDPDALRADVVTAPHHGSAGSSGPEFIAATHARYVVASAGYLNKFRHPRPEVVERWSDAGATFLSTQSTGAVQLDFTGGRIAVLAERARRHRLWDGMARAPAAGGLSYRSNAVTTARIVR